jgi:MoxR-like ATPase
MLPADIVGTLIYNPRDGRFETKHGPLFANLILADEINRAPAKVQSALLEAMQEHQVTLGETTHALPSPFMVMATQNPVEQEGTYPLPEAQIDRFLLKVIVTYPSPDEELAILGAMATSTPQLDVSPVLTPDELFAARRAVDAIYIDERVRRYIVSLVVATRDPAAFGLDLAPLIRFGASPRASIALALCAKSIAFLQGRGYVTPQDVKVIAPDVLRHRIAVTYEAEAERIDSEQLVTRILDQVAIP